MPRKKLRVDVPPDVAAEVQFLSHRICCVCRAPGKDIQIHHLDEDPSNNELSNLAVLCIECHNKTLIRGGFGRQLDVRQIRLYRDDWHEIVARRRAEGIVVALSQEPPLTPRLALRLLQPDDATPHEEITINRTGAPFNSHFAFGLVLENMAESTTAEKIGIRVEIYWRGAHIEKASGFFVDRPPSEGWKADVQWLTYHQPAVLAFQGSDRERCFAGQPLVWDKFRLHLRDRAQGHFLLSYVAASAQPLTESKGELRINII